MERQATISIIIPTHLNAAATWRLMSSCVTQLSDGDELIIVVDDPSHAPSYACFNDRNVSVLVNKKNIGAAASRNKGIEMAQKDIVLFIDSDCLIPKNLIESHRSAHKMSSTDIIVAGKTTLTEDGHWYDELVRECDFFRNGYELRMKMPAGDVMFAPTSNISGPAHIYKKHRFKEDFPKKGGGEDNLWCLMAREIYSIHDLAAPIKQPVWHGFFCGVLKRLFRWGASEVLVVIYLERAGLGKYVESCQNQTYEFFLNYRKGSSLFSKVAPRIHRLGYISGCIQCGRFDLLNKYINHSGA